MKNFNFKFKFRNVKRCKFCAARLDEKGKCTWIECPHCPKYKEKKEK